jgi:hypothetical protein
MSKVDAYEQKILKAFENGTLKSVATKGELEKVKAAAGATAKKDRRVKIARRSRKPATL